ncbi:MAG: antirepressor regulating drug resistance protein, partial [Acetatifactor sp.]|nr:antirepressor regulating drug resistance protein [Acetatifactor sp.]
MNWYTFLPALLNMSVTAGVVILFVIFARLLLRKAPKIFSYVLWYVVLFRLFCPVAVGSSLSLLGILDTPIVETHSAVSSIEYIPGNIVHTEFPEIQIPVPGVSDVVNRQLPQGAEQLGADPLEFPITFATYIWGAGFLAMAVYSVIAYFGIRKKLKVVIPLRDNILIADDIKSP